MPSLQLERSIAKKNVLANLEVVKFSELFLANSSVRHMIQQVKESFCTPKSCYRALKEGSSWDGEMQGKSVF